MKNLFLILLMFIPIALFAQDTIEDLPTDFNGIVEFLLPAIFGQLSVIFADAKKYMGSGMWDWSVFFKTKIGPFLLTSAVTVGIYLLLVYAPFMEPFIEVLTGPIGEITAFTLFAAAQALIVGLSKPTVSPEEPGAINTKQNKPIAKL